MSEHSDTYIYYVLYIQVPSEHFDKAMNIGTFLYSFHNVLCIKVSSEPSDKAMHNRMFWYLLVLMFYTLRVHRNIPIKPWILERSYTYFIMFCVSRFHRNLPIVMHVRKLRFLLFNVLYKGPSEPSDKAMNIGTFLYLFYNVLCIKVSSEPSDRHACQKAPILTFWCSI